MAGGLLAAAVLIGTAALVAFLAGDSSSGPSDAASNASPCEAAGRDDDSNRQVRLTATDEWIEFEFWSSEPFPVRALFPVVRIGTRDFSRSRYGDDGRLNTLIFFIPREEFDLLNPDDLVWVYYGGAGSPPPSDFVPDVSDPWSFGSFNKRLLDCPTTEESRHTDFLVGWDVDRERVESDPSPSPDTAP